MAPEQVRARVIHGRQPIPPLQHADEGLLCELFGLQPVARHEPEVSVDLIALLLEELVE